MDHGGNWQLDEKLDLRLRFACLLWCFLVRRFLYLFFILLRSNAQTIRHITFYSEKMLLYTCLLAVTWWSNQFQGALNRPWYELVRFWNCYLSTQHCHCRPDSIWACLCSVCITRAILLAKYFLPLMSPAYYPVGSCKNNFFCRDMYR